jgi:death-on-curing protein
MAPRKLIKPIAVEDVEYLAHAVATEHLRFEEPIPEFGTRFPHRLESCLLTPFQSFGGKDLYPTLIDKAAILFYLMIKNHPFQNGNKRLAITTLQTFLWLNGKWLMVPPEELYNITILVAVSPPQAKDEIVRILHRFMRTNVRSPRSSVSENTTP